MKKKKLVHETVGDIEKQYGVDLGVPNDIYFWKYLESKGFKSLAGALRKSEEQIALFESANIPDDEMGRFIRDVTKLGSIPKSEVRRRLKDMFSRANIATLRTAELIIRETWEDFANMDVYSSQSDIIDVVFKTIIEELQKLKKQLPPSK